MSNWLAHYGIEGLSDFEPFLMPKRFNEELNKSNRVNNTTKTFKCAEKVFTQKQQKQQKRKTVCGISAMRISNPILNANKLPSKLTRRSFIALNCCK